MANHKRHHGWEPMGPVLSGIAERVGVPPTGVPSGFQDLDRLLGGGWRNSDLTVIGARPAMGKTALAVQFALNASIRFRSPTALFSPSLPKERIAWRVLAMGSRTDFHTMLNMALEKGALDAIRASAADWADAPLFMNDHVCFSRKSLRRGIGQLIGRHGVKLLIVDDLQGLRPMKRKRSRKQFTIMIVNTLKEIAVAWDIPVVLFSQVDQEVEARKDRRPRLTDIAPCSIQEIADVVGFIYRPEYYDHKRHQGKVEIIIRKNRRGPTGEISLRFRPEYASFEEIR